MTLESSDVIRKSLKMVGEGAKHLPEKADPERDLEELHFELTYQCNQKCIMCNIWNRYRNEPGFREKELKLEEIKRFVESSESLKNIKVVLFSGGEPFLRDDIGELCGFFSEKFPSISISILSNLYNTRLTVNRLKEIIERYNPKSLWIGSSLDGIGETHDSIRGVGGAFDGLAITIKTIRKEYPQVNIGLNFTLTTKNYKELLPAFEFSIKDNLDFSAQFAIPWDGAEKFKWTEKELSEIQESTDKIIEGIIEQHKKKKCLLPGVLEKLDTGLLARIYYWHGLTRYQREQRRFFKRCTAGAKYAMFSPTGDLYFCPPLKDHVVGNIRDFGYDFDRLWMSDNAIKAREFINSGVCHCWLNCIVYPNVGDAINNGRNMFEKLILRVGRKSGRLLKRLFMGILD